MRMALTIATLLWALSTVTCHAAYDRDAIEQARIATAVAADELCDRLPAETPILFRIPMCEERAAREEHLQMVSISMVVAGFLGLGAYFGWRRFRASSTS